MKKAIYIITNSINNKVYIGQSIDPNKRWVAHQSRARTQCDKGRSPIHDAMYTLGIEHFQCSILGWYDDYNEKEREFIKKYNSLVPNGYNLMPGGEEPPHSYGEQHHNSKYSQQLIDNIITDLCSHQYTQKEIQDKYQVSQQLITSINRGVTHRREDLHYPIIQVSNYHLTAADVDDIRYLLKNSKCTCAEIAQYFNTSTSAIKHINAGRNYFDPSITYPIRNFRGSANSQSVEAILAKRSTETIDTPSEM